MSKSQQRRLKTQMKLSERIHQWGIACESPTLFGFANEVAQLEAELDTERSMRHEAQSDYGNQMEKIEQLEAELEQWRAEHQDETDPKIRPMTRMENAWMDAEGKIGSLEAELAGWKTTASNNKFIYEAAKAENAAAFELLDVYEKENERLRFACKQALMGIEEGYLPPKITDDLRDALKEGE